jgi:hypothetical protein
VPLHSHAIQALDAANQWTINRIAAKDWAVYAANEEGVAWTSARAVIDRLKPAFALAVRGDASLATTYPKLASLLGAKSVIAKKSVNTKAANDKQRARGETPTHGASARRKALKAAKDAATETPSGSPSPTTSSPTTTAPAATPPAGPSTTNGAAHS